MSKTWLFGFIAGLIIQYQPTIEGALPYLTELAQALPEPVGTLVGLALPPAFAWLTAALFAWARNQAADQGSKANPLTGLKTKDYYIKK